MLEPTRPIDEPDLGEAGPRVHVAPRYEDLLNRDPRWALSEGSRHFEEESAVFKALHHIARRLEELAIPYAVVGGMALFKHGYRRFTEDVDILVTRDDLKSIHAKLEGLGYVPPFANSKSLRDTQFGVKIEFLVTGGFPGDGKAKPVSFPDPRTVSFEADGISYITLAKLVELKLASGMTSAGRLKDLSDVLELIKAIDLPVEFANKLDPFVRGKYSELWTEAQKRYVMVCDVGKLSAEQLDAMQKDGVLREDDRAVSAGRLRFVTTDAKVAAKYGMMEESEWWGDEEN